MVYVGILATMAVLRFLLPRDTEKNRRIFASAACLLLVFFAAVRAPEVGRDTTLFLEVFAKLHGRPFLDVFKFSSWVEPGFRLLCAVIAFFTDNGQWLIVISSVIIHVSVSVFIYRHAKNVYLAFFLYMAMMIYPFYFNTMRQALAVAVLLFAWGFFKKRRYVVYSVLVLLAASFHTSALLFLLCPLLTLIPVNKKTLRWLLPLAGVLALLGAIFVRPLIGLVTTLFPRYADYTPTTFDALFWYLAVFVVITAYGVYCLFYAPGAVTEKQQGFDERGFLTLMMLFGVIVAAMMTGFGQLQRVFNYFEVLYLLWLPAAVPPAYYREDRRHIAFPLSLIAVLLAATAYFLVILFGRSALWYDALPYRFFWQ